MHISSRDHISATKRTLYPIMGQKVTLDTYKQTLINTIVRREVANSHTHLQCRGSDVGPHALCGRLVLSISTVPAICYL